MGGVMSTISDNCKKITTYLKGGGEGATTRDLGRNNRGLQRNLNSSNKNIYYPPDMTNRTTRATKITISSSEVENYLFASQKFEKLSVVYNTKTFPMDKRNLENKKSSLEDFIILKLLGKGTFGKVLLVRNRKDNRLYAMKVLKKDKVFKYHQIDHTKTEREILEKINHPFIVKLFFAFQNEEKLYLVTEFMQGGELFFHLKKAKVFSEDKARLYICEIILAIEHLHKNKIIYRDLKPENILLDTEGHVKLADFGLSKFFTTGNIHNVSDTKSNISNDNSFVSTDKAFTLCGTPEYLAPEILTGKGYDKSVDWWSLGVLMYEMLCGTSPFKKRKRNQKLNLEYYQNPIVFVKPSTVSSNAQDLILLLLKSDPIERLNSAVLIKEHPFFNGVNWDNIFNRKVSPQFIPNNHLKSDEDLMFFDKTFTDTIVNNQVEEVGENSNNNISNKVLHNNIKIHTKDNTSNKHHLFKKMKRFRDDFRNFSFTRDEDFECTK